MNIEQTVLENLRLLPTDKQQDVLVFIHSLLPSEQTSLNSSQKDILSNLCTTLQQIQNFHDGLPSAAYANRLLQSTQALIAAFPNHPLNDFAQALYQFLHSDGDVSQLPPQRH